VINGISYYYIRSSCVGMYCSSHVLHGYAT